MSTNWFEIDKKGLAQILARKGKEFAIFELVQNAWDEPGVTQVEINLQTLTPAYVKLTVRDNSPNGFASLTDAYTLFAPSKKKDNPQQRGRFNLGEKLVLALSRKARVSTTHGSVHFDEGGRRSSNETVAGSEVQVEFRMNKDEAQQATQACLKLIPPNGILTTINGCPIESPSTESVFEVSLLTEVSDAEGQLVRTTRKTRVEVYRADEAHPAAIYEMGIPVCEIEGKYCFNVMQKVPLTMDREEVLPQFKKQLAVAALNQLHGIIDVEDANTGWATEAVTSPDAKPEALEAYMTKRFGEKRVSFDPSDPEANHTAAAAGYTVITGSQLSRSAWANVKAAGAVLPAGQVLPTPKPYDENAPPLPAAEITPGMREVETYAKKFAKELCSASITVFFGNKATWPYAATYGPCNLTFNVGRLGKAWFNLQTNQCAIDNLLIHELGHHYCINHLDKAYNDALTLIGAKLAQAIRQGRM